MKSILIIGMGRFGRHLCRKFMQLGDEVMIVDNNERVINVRGNIDGQPVKFKFYVRQNSYHYVFEDGSSSDLERDDDDDDDDEKDDENNDDLDDDDD